jgi:hypothetical protein
VTFSAVTVGLQEYSGNVVDGTMVDREGAISVLASAQQARPS